MKKILFSLLLVVILLLPKLSFAQSNCPLSQASTKSNEELINNCSISELSQLSNDRLSSFSLDFLAHFSNDRLLLFSNDFLIKFPLNILKQFPESRIKTFSCDVQQQLRYSCGSPTSTPTPYPTIIPTPTPVVSPSPVPSGVPLPKKPVKIIISQFQRADQILDPSIPNSEAKISLNFAQNGIANVRFQVNYDSTGQDVAIYYVQYKLKQKSELVPPPDQYGITHLTSCQEITKPGNYVLDKDLSENIESKCLYIHDTDNVNVNCQNHTISMDATTMLKNFRSGKDTEGATLLIKNVHNFAVKSCNIQVTHADKVTDGITIQVNDSQAGEISNNTIGAYYFFVKRSSDLKITNNKSNAIYQQNNTDRTFISDNNFLAAPVNEAGAGGVILNDGSNNQVINNTVDGGSDGVFKGLQNSIGTDDGIILFNETGDIIKNNIILNNWDCGIETSYIVKNTQFIGNKIKNSGACGIGGWYWISWLGNTVSNNIVEDSPQLLTFFRAYGLLTERNEQIAYFKDNTFLNNKLISQKENGPLGAYSTIIDMENVYYKGEIPADKWVRESNTLSNNDFGTQNPIIIRPAKIIIDGGGNICRPGMGSDFPLACGRSQPSNAVSRIQSINTKDLTNQVNKALQTTESLPTKDSNEQLPQPTPTATPGPLKLIDFNGDGVVNIFDRIIFARKKLGL